MRGRLAARGIPADAIERTVADLLDEGYLDDARLAVEYIVARSARLGHGRGRLLADLRRRGVPGETAEAVWTRVVDAGDLDPDEVLARAAARRVERCGGRLNTPAYRRVHTSLLRAGFETEDIRRVLDPYRATADLVHEPDTDGIDHDFP